MLERLHKILARSGVAALRPAEDMILAGRVTVNGRIVRELGARADAEQDTITVDGQVVTVPTAGDPHRYFLLHKPVGVISTAYDPEGRPTVTSLVPQDVRVFPVGRLDADSEGLLLLTDDGDLAYRLTHPRFGIEKEYRVLLDKALSVEAMRQWRGGVILPDGERTAPAWVEILDRAEYGDWLRVVLQEGKKREIREVARILGYDVRRLIRVREGPILLDNVPEGTWRALSADEVESLRRYTQHVPSREADEARESNMSDSERGPRRLRIMRKPQRPDTAAEAATGATTPLVPGDDVDTQPAPAERPDVQAARPAQPPRTRFDGRPAPGEEARGFQLPPAERGNERFEPDRRANVARPRDDRGFGSSDGPRGRFDPTRGPQRPADRPPSGPRQDGRPAGRPYNGPRQDVRPGDRPYNGPRQDVRPGDRPYPPRREGGFTPGPRNNERSGGYDRRPQPRREDERPRFADRGAPRRDVGPPQQDSGNTFNTRDGGAGADRGGPPRDGPRPFRRPDDRQPRSFGGPPSGPRREGGFGERRPNAAGGPPRPDEQQPSRGIRDFSNRSSFERRGPAPRAGGFGSRPPQRRDDGGRPGGFGSRPPRPDDGGRPGGFGSRPPRPDDRRNDERPRGFGERPSGPNRYEGDRGQGERPNERSGGGFGDRSAPPRFGGPSSGGGSRFGGPSSGGSSRFGGPSRGGSSRFGGPPRGGAGGSRFGGGSSSGRSGPPSGGSPAPRRRKKD